MGLDLLTDRQLQCDFDFDCTSAESLPVKRRLGVWCEVAMSQLVVSSAE
jgi:hypothetical protein